MPVFLMGFSNKEYFFSKACLSASPLDILRERLFFFELWPALLKS